MSDETTVIIGEDRSLKDVFRIVRRVAKTGSTVLVTGETGTGKELVVQTLHNLSGRKGPFVPVNCGAMPGDLVESELFGAEKGAYTGSNRTREGRFELANRGTLFLDEIGEMPLPLQVKILRALQEKEVQRLGGDHPIKVDVRVVAATNRDLEEEVRKGTFREDLFYRLSVIPVHLPALRERGEDILALARHYLGVFCRENGRKALNLSQTAEEMLMTYPWPGNVRELENFMYRVSVLAEGDIVEPSDLPEKIQAACAGHAAPQPGVDSLKAAPQGLGATTPALAGDRFAWPTLDQLQGLGLSLKEFLAQVEDRLVGEALAREKGVHQQAAELLGIKRTTLIEKLRRKGLLQS